MTIVVETPWHHLNDYTSSHCPFAERLVVSWLFPQLPNPMIKETNSTDMYRAVSTRGPWDCFVPIQAISQAALELVQPPAQPVSSLWTLFYVTDQHFPACRKPAAKVQCQ